MTLKLLLVAALLVAGAVAFWRWARDEPRRAAVRVVENGRYVATPPRWTDPATAVPTRVNRTLTAAQKAAAVEKIRRDYDELRSKVAAEYMAAGASFPGGLNGFLRQLALLEEERRRDLLGYLSAGELEDLEYRESRAGELVRRWLADTTATEEQRRAVFRLQREFDDRFGFTFDLSPAFLATRERERQSLQVRIRAELGDALFGAWLRGEGTDFAGYAGLASRYGLAPTVPIELWHLRNLYTLQQLDIRATPAASPAERARQEAGLRAVEQRVRVLLGPAADDPAARQLLTWLPAH